MLGRVGGLTVRARLLVLGGTLAGLLALVAIIAFTGFSSIESAYNADQIPGTQRDLRRRPWRAGSRPTTR